MSIGSIIMIIFYLFLIVLLIFPKTKLYLRTHRELATAILYTYLVVWFTRVLLGRKTIEAIIDKMHTNGLYLFLLIFYVGVPLYFAYKSIQNYVMYFTKKKDETKEEKIEEKEEDKKEVFSTKKGSKKNASSKRKKSN